MNRLAGFAIVGPLTLLTTGCFAGGGQGGMEYRIRGRLVDGETGEGLGCTEYRLDVWIDDEVSNYRGWWYGAEEYALSTECDATFSEDLLFRGYSVSMGFIPSPPPPPMPEPVDVKVTVVLDECEQPLVIPIDAVEVEAYVPWLMELHLGTIVVPPCDE